MAPVVLRSTPNDGSSQADELSVESEPRYTFVGVAVLTIIAALIGAILWLKHTGTRDQFRAYTINFEHSPLDGLQVGGDVEMRGIKVGRVEDYAISATNINRVQVKIRVDRRTPVSENTVATLSRNYVTGIARISLITPGQPGPPLIEAPAGEPYPVIAEGRSEFEEFRVTLRGLGEQSAQALDAINQTLNAQNREALSGALASLQKLSDGLAERLPRLDGAIATFNASATEMSRSSTRFVVATERLERQLEPTIDQTRQTLQDASSALRAFERESAKLVGRLGDTAASVDDQFTIAVIELRASIEGIARVVERLEDPRAALFGPTDAQLGPGERFR